MKIIKYIILALTILLLFTGIVSATIMNTSFPSVYISFNTTSDLTKTIDNNEYTLTNYGVAINTDNYKFGGGSGYFNGSSHEYSNGNPITSAPYSITGWINTSVTTESILDFGTSSTAAGLAFHLLNGVWIVDDGHASGSGPQGGHVALNEWNYYAIIANGTTTALYVNGTLINTHAGTTMYGTPTRFSLGAHGYGSTWGLIYSGYMDDIVFYNHAINGTVVPDRELISNPMASFSQNVTHGNAPLSISFTNTSLGNIADTNYNWSYTNSSATGGNGTQIFWSNVASPTAILTTGNWSINETITNPFGDSTALSWVNVSPGSPPIANFTYSPTSGPSPLTVDFTDTSASSITAWNWTFGAANYSSLQNPSYTFVGAGNYSVTLQVTNASGTNTTINYVDVLAVTDPNPTSMIKYKSGESSIAISNQSQPYVGTVTARNITSNTTYIAGNFTWIPGNVAVSNIRINQSAVNISGASLISSSINNANGHALFNISNPSGFTSPANALIDFNITYTKYLAPGSRVNFSYSLPYCRYYDPVNVTWWTFNQYQGADAIIGTWGPVTANFTANVTAVAEYAPIQFTDTSTGYPDAWGWDFGDGSTSSAQNPVYSYATTGLKTVSLHSYMA
ncbi:MAG: PKD domain-containing protein, partial [Candidatus Paceibacterota bacterium]